MWSPNTPRRKDARLVMVVVAAVVVVMCLGEGVVASYSVCIRPMEVECEPHLMAGDIDDKIAGGHIAEPGSTPWLVSLQDIDFEDPVPFCGGTLLSHTWVLTSATCVYSYQGIYDNIQVVLGEYDMTEIDGWERYRKVSHIIFHPEYDFYSHNADVALIRLGFYVHYNERIDILRLPTRQPAEEEVIGAPAGGEDHLSDNNREDLYTIAGWGRVGESGEPSPVVRVAQVSLLSHEECQTVYPEFTETMICAGNFTHGGLDPCQGDMGGALANADGFIKGVSSWSVGCGRPGYPGVYTDVEQMTDWICSVTDSDAHKPSDRLPSCR